MGIVNLGFIDIPYGLVTITDPYKSKGDSLRLDDVKVKPGLYTCEYFVRRLSNVVSMMRISHVDIDYSKTTRTVPMRFKNIETTEGISGFQVSPVLTDQLEIYLRYKGFPEITRGVIFDNGFYCQSGRGSGFYSVDYKKSRITNEIVELRVLFL